MSVFYVTKHNHEKKENLIAKEFTFFPKKGKFLQRGLNIPN